jgi:cytochrome P450
MHHNETYFPDAGKFDPTRWLDPKESRRMEKVFVPFSKGSRACGGIKYVSFVSLNCLSTELLVWHIANYTLP